MVRPKGFEPLTFWSVARRSIQLSYRRTVIVNLLNAGSRDKTPRVTPVAGAKIITGLIPCNVIPEEILTDHPGRYRALVVQSGNPVHSLADSQRMRQAIRSLEFSVAIDVAMTETAREVDYVLPATTQFEKAEATFDKENEEREALANGMPIDEVYRVFGVL